MVQAVSLRPSGNSETMKFNASSSRPKSRRVPRASAANLSPPHHNSVAGSSQASCARSSMFIGRCSLVAGGVLPNAH
jgi:hypothetical protein